jgi:diacylglycerol O-acyltransferase / wax synthase
MPPERLTALDASFLYLERPAMHMHVAGLSVLDPSTRPDGRLRFEDVEAVFASRLHLAPRLRQKVKMVPFGLALPVWVDDASFDLDFHIRRAALPHPGGSSSASRSSGSSRARSTGPSRCGSST